MAGTYVQFNYVRKIPLDAKYIIQSHELDQLLLETAFREQQ